MPLGLAEQRAQKYRRRRVWVFTLKWGLLLGVVAVAGLYAYDVGEILATADVRRLEENVVRLTDENNQFRQENIELLASMQTGAAEIGALEDRYARNVPPPEIARILDLVRQRMGDGLSSERIAFVIRAAQEQDECDYGPITKRFSLTTPIYQSAADTVRFADNTIMVRGDGQALLNDAGQPLAWYDPAQPVTIQFTHIGGDVSNVTGRLPLQHSIVVNDNEFRFNIVEGERSFVEVTSDSCAFP